MSLLSLPIEEVKPNIFKISAENLWQLYKPKEERIANNSLRRIKSVRKMLRKSMTGNIKIFKFNYLIVISINIQVHLTKKSNY